MIDWGQAWGRERGTMAEGFKELGHDKSALKRSNETTFSTHHSQPPRGENDPRTNEDEQTKETELSHSCRKEQNAHACHSINESLKVTLSGRLHSPKVADCCRTLENVL